MKIDSAIVSLTLDYDRPLAKGTYPVRLKVTHKRERLYLRIKGLSSSREEWIEGNNINDIPSRFKGKFSIEKNETLRVWENKAKDVIKKMDALNRPFTFDSFRQLLKSSGKNHTVFSFFKEVIAELKNNDQLASRDSYRDTLNRLKEVTKEKDLSFGDLDYRFLEEFVIHYKKKLYNEASIAVYLRVIRAVFNRAIARELIDADLYPFKKFKIRTPKPKRKRALSKETMLKYFSYNAEVGSEKWHTINYFKFSYLCRGMNLGDIIGIRWDKNINDKRIRYGRSKTGDPLDVKIEPAIEEILNHYRQPGNPYAFPILKPDLKPTVVKGRLKRLSKIINKNLKLIGDDLELPMAQDVTFYWARHTYANVLRKAGVSVRMIGEAFGHESEKTTEIYLNSVENEELDVTYQYIL